jgi:copper chaperone
MTTLTIPIEGMTCGHCEASVRQALSNLPGVQVQAVDKVRGEATVDAPAATTRKQLADAVEDIGFAVPAGWASA